MAWSTPKTNWIVTDRFNITDYNRIKNNIAWLHDKAEKLLKHDIDYNDMGADVSGYTGYRTAKQFNDFEQNVDIVNEEVFPRDLGETKTFYPNGAFIDYNELNRLESATVTIREDVDGLEAGISDKHLAFTLGQYNSIKV